MYALDENGKPRSFNRVVFLACGIGYGMRISSESHMLEIWELRCDKETAACSMVACRGRFLRITKDQIEAAESLFNQLTAR